MKTKRVVDDLLDCPFCGSRPNIFRIGNDYSKKRTIEIKCSKCLVKVVNSAIRNSFEWLEDISFSKWNNRVEK